MKNLQSTRGEDTETSVEVVDGEWVTFPGGELEGRRPKARCASCRQGSTEAGSRRGTLCFECYREELTRERALKAAGELDTASVARFQCGLPFEPVNWPRLEMLRAERARSRAASQDGLARFADRRRQAQIAARRALQQASLSLRDRGAADAEQVRVMMAAAHAAELQLPESWLPFVVAR